MSDNSSTRTLFFPVSRVDSVDPEKVLPAVDSLIERVNTLNNFKSNSNVEEALRLLIEKRNIIESVLHPQMANKIDSGAGASAVAEAEHGPSVLKRA